MKKTKSIASAISVDTAYCGRTADELVKILGGTPQGLGTEIAHRRLIEVGRNTLEAQEQVNAFGLFLNQFKSPIVLILLFATLISAFVRDWTDAIIILAIVLGSAALSFTQEYNASNAAEKLKAQVNVKAKVLRDGQEQSIAAEEVVPGDVVILSAGSLIPADGVLLEAKDFFVNQAVLTGETYPVEKSVGAVPANAALTERIVSSWGPTSAAVLPGC